MSDVRYLKCDGCNRQVERPSWEGRSRWAPPGWIEVLGTYDVDGDPDELLHACSHDCHVELANRMRRAAELGRGTAGFLPDVFRAT